MARSTPSGTASSPETTGSAEVTTTRSPGSVCAVSSRWTPVRSCSPESPPVGTSTMSHLCTASSGVATASPSISARAAPRLSGAVPTQTSTPLSRRFRACAAATASNPRTATCRSCRSVRSAESGSSTEVMRPA
ncbi:hypothetical protein BJF81_00645 [Ornithinimicrobium sp. CNJ-824]|nr:hypothetical protein BJF81_00645 [Ornithinimicrobium sp. CNJ-824]